MNLYKGYVMTSIDNAKGKTKSIHDNINNALEEFDISDFLDGSEAGEYVKDIPGVKDLLMKIKNTLGFLKGLSDKIMGYINKLLNILDKFFDSIEDILQSVLKLFNSALGPFGISMVYKQSILESILGGCIVFRTTEGRLSTTVNSLLAISLTGILTIAVCEGDTRVYSVVYDEYTDAAGINEDRNALVDELENARSNRHADAIREEINELLSEIYMLLYTEGDEGTMELINSIVSSTTTVTELRTALNIALTAGVYNGESIQNISDRITEIELTVTEMRNRLRVVIDESNDSNVVELRDNLVSLERRLLVVENLVLPISESPAIANRRLLLSESISDINTSFSEVASMVMYGMSRSNIKPGILISGVHDILSTTPGVMAIRSNPGLRDALCISIDKAVSKTGVGDIYYINDDTTYTRLEWFLSVHSIGGSQTVDAYDIEGKIKAPVNQVNIIQRINPLNVYDLSRELTSESDVPIHIRIGTGIKQPLGMNYSYPMSQSILDVRLPDVIGRESTKVLKSILTDMEVLPVTGIDNLELYRLPSIKYFVNQELEIKDGTEITSVEIESIL